MAAQPASLLRTPLPPRICSEEFVVSAEPGLKPRIVIRELCAFGEVQMTFSPETARVLAAYLLHAAASVDGELSLEEPAHLAAV
jgi:hypothetical protein